MDPPSWTRQLLACLCLTTLLTACGPNSPEKDAARRSLSGVDTTFEKSTRLIDDRQALTGTPRIEHITRDSAIIRDGTTQLYLFVDHTQVRTIGSPGNGPCQYASVVSFDVHGGHLFVLDDAEGRLIEFPLGEQGPDCVSEHRLSSLTNFAGMEVTRTGIYLARGGFTSRSSTTTSLLYRLDGRTDSLKPVLNSPALQDANMLLLPTPVRVPVSMDQHEGEIFWYIPPGREIWTYRPSDQTFSSIPVSVEIPKKKGDSLSDFLELINQAEIGWDLDVGSRFLALTTAHGQGENQVWRARFLDRSGKQIEILTLPGRTADIRDGILEVMRPVTEPKDVTYPFRIMRFRLNFR